MRLDAEWGVASYTVLDALVGPAPAPQTVRMDKLRAVAVAPLKGVALGALTLPVVLHAAFTLLTWAPLLGLSLALSRPPPVEAGRALTNIWRRLVGALSGVDIEVPYRPAPPRPVPDSDGTYTYDDHVYKTHRWPWLFQRIKVWSEDPATGRDFFWMLTYPFVAGPAAVLPAALIAAGIAAPLRGNPLWTIIALPVGFAAGPALVRLSGAWSRRWLRPVTPRTLARKLARDHWIEHNGLQVVRAATLAGLGLLCIPLLLFSLGALTLSIGLGMVFLLPTAVQHFRWLANLRRELARDWSGVDIAVPYRGPAEPELRSDGRYRVGRDLYKSERMARFNARWNVAWRDPAGWRDLLWLTVDPIVGGLIALGPVLLVCYGLWTWTFSGLLSLLGAPHTTWYGAVAGSPVLAIPAGIALAALGVWLMPRVLRWHGRWTAVLLRPTKAAVLGQRVERLTRTRADAIDAQSVEIRRIERDLHDGAQARLIAVGLTLGAIERLMDTDPAAARQLVAQARETSATALAELRDLVRGILPPVLSERGLGDAVRALALDAGVPVRVTVDLLGRPPAPVESAVFFAVSELLANAVRHSRATAITVDLRHRDGVLRATVRDDGDGGADRAQGTGLRGIERRLGSFDGTLAVRSPRGGPTEVTLEVPCALSSPKTSTSSGTA
jgi:signal transduction histidine kinase